MEKRDVDWRNLARKIWWGRERGKKEKEEKEEKEKEEEVTKEEGEEEVEEDTEGWAGNRRG